MRERRGQERIDPALWRRTDMRTALAARDIAAVFRILQRAGVSQRRIAALTGQSQSEISEILGGRQVVSYEVLARIADGLGVPRGHLGLAYDESTAQLVGASTAPQESEDESATLTRLAELTIGTATVDPRNWSRPFPVAWDSPPSHLGMSDVARLENVTSQLRALDYAHGGGSCRDAVLAQVGWAQQMLRATVSDEVARPLHIAIADLHLLAGWVSFDVGMLGPARRHLARSLEHARFVDEPSLVAKVLYSLARIHLHHGWAARARRLLQLGQVAAEQSGCARAMALLDANLAWAHALLGDVRQTMNAIARAKDEYGRSELEETPRWLLFFDSAELQALRATALASLPEPTPQQRSEAIDRFCLSTALRELSMARSRAFELTSLARLLLEEGEIEQGIHIGHQAVDVAAQVRSRRVADRMAPLHGALQRHLNRSEARDLAERIAALPT